jgi:NADH-ubiquinone oxidoreductase chain 2
MLIFVYCFILLISIINVKFIEKGISLLGGLLFSKFYTQIFINFLFLLVIIILILTSYYPRKIISLVKLKKSIFNEYEEKFITNYFSYNESQGKDLDISDSFIANTLNKKGEQFKLIEYSLIIIFVILGAIFLMSSNDIITIFLSIELQSYGLYIICTLYRNSELSTNAGLTYFLLGGLSSCIILLGQGLLYLSTGNTSLDSLYLIEDIFKNVSFDELNATVYFYLKDNNLLSYEDFSVISSHYSIQISLIIMSVGFLFKISAAPFHFWSPDVYDAIPTIVTTFVAIIAKISILIMMLELVYFTCNTLLSWRNNIILSSLLSLIIGSVLGLTQFRIKRLYAYSTISHLGFLLLALSISNIESTQAFFFYLIQYSISNLNAFIILIAIGYSFFSLIHKSNSKNKYLNDITYSIHEEKNLKDVNYSPVQLIYQLKGFFKINPLLSISLALTLFSFIGVPPLIGFFGKQMVLSAALDGGYIFITIIAILTSVISAVYYLVVIKNIFFEENNYEFNPNLKNFLNSHDNSQKNINYLVYKWDNQLLLEKDDLINIKFNKERNVKKRFIYRAFNRHEDNLKIETNLIYNLKQIINNNNKIFYKYKSDNNNNIILSSSLTNIISIITLIILLFILFPKEFFNLTIILSLYYI